MKLAGCIILDEKGRILLLHRNTAKRVQWEIPGGKIDEDEDTKTTAIRELKEELGVDVEIARLLSEKEFTEDGFTLHYSWFLAKVKSGEPKNAEPEIFDDLRYFSLEEMEKEVLSSGAQTFLELVKNGSISL